MAHKWQEGDEFHYKDTLDVEHWGTVAEVHKRRGMAVVVFACCNADGKLEEIELTKIKPRWPKTPFMDDTRSYLDTLWEISDESVRADKQSG